jgi:hypothetical protein
MQLHNLIGFNNFLPEICLLTIPQKTIYNTSNGQAVVEWDALPPDVEIDIDWPPQDTMIVLEILRSYPEHPEEASTNLPSAEFDRRASQRGDLDCDCLSTSEGECSDIII